MLPVIFVFTNFPLISLLEVRREAIDEDTAEVEFTYRIYAMIQVMVTRETLELLKEDKWKIDKMQVINQSLNG